MDRNSFLGFYCLFGLVALRKESVDRNLSVFVIDNVHSLSLSARRAWIEIATLNR